MFVGAIYITTSQKTEYIHIYLYIMSEGEW